MLGKRDHPAVRSNTYNAGDNEEQCDEESVEREDEYSSGKHNIGKHAIEDLINSSLDERFSSEEEDVLHAAAAAGDADAVPIVKSRAEEKERDSAVEEEWRRGARIANRSVLLREAD